MYVRFYTDTHRFMGVSKNPTYPELLSWVSSGNYLKIGKKVITKEEDVPKYFE